MGVPKNVVDCQKALDELINLKNGNEYAEGEITTEEHFETIYKLNLGDTITTCYGSATFTKDEDAFGLHHFEVSLGPANSKRMIEFLLALPEEPEEDDES
jgi:hypothetical protein